LEDIVLAVALDVEARVVPLAAARVAGAALPSEAEQPAWAAALPAEAERPAWAAPLSAEVGPQAARSVQGAAAVLVWRPQLVSAVGLPVKAQPAAAELIAAQARGLEPGVEVAWAQGRSSASRPARWAAIRACLPEA
jgi:hypothetical protein